MYVAGMKIFDLLSLGTVLCLWLCYLPVIVADDPVCTSAIRQSNGLMDVAATVYNCANNIQGSMYPPSYFNGNGTQKFQPTVINMSASINTLINIDDVNAQVTFDMFFRIYWTDPRWNLPSDMWDSLHPVVRDYEGLEITPYVRAQNQLQIWLPDIQIMEAVETNSVAELIHLFPNGSIFWSRHIVLTVTQAQMDLHLFPNDNQAIEISLQSFAYSDDLVVLAPITSKGFIGFNTIPSRPETTALSLNRLWTYETSSSTIIQDKASIFFHPHRRFSTVLLQIRFSRQNFGILLRMVLPIAIFMTVVAFTFWADLSKRIDVSVQMLLVVSSLYFVIGQFIPFVGYFTTFDQFVTIFFGLLGITIGIHFITYQLDSIKEDYPMALVMKEGLVLGSRICALPILFGVVYIFFPTNLLYFVIPACAVMICVVSQGLFSFPEFLRSVYFCVCKLRYMHALRLLKQQEEKMKTFHSPASPAAATQLSNTEFSSSSSTNSPTPTTNLHTAPPPPLTLPYKSSPNVSPTPYSHQPQQILTSPNNVHLYENSTILLDQMIRILMEANQALENTMQQYLPAYPPVNAGYDASHIPNRLLTKAFQLPHSLSSPSTSIYLPQPGKSRIPNPSISSHNNSFRDNQYPIHQNVQPSNTHNTNSHSLSMYSFSKYVNNPPAAAHDSSNHILSQQDSQYILPRVASNYSAESAPTITQPHSSFEPTSDIIRPPSAVSMLAEEHTLEDGHHAKHPHGRRKKLQRKHSTRDVHFQSMGIPEGALLSDEEIQENLIVQFDHKMFGRAMELRVLYLLRRMECCKYHQHHPVKNDNPFLCANCCYSSAKSATNPTQRNVEDDTESPKYSYTNTHEEFPTLEFVEYESSKHNDQTNSVPSRERISPHASVSKPLHVFYHNTPSPLPDFPASYSRNPTRVVYSQPSISPSQSGQSSPHSIRHSTSEELPKSMSRDSRDDDMLMYERKRQSLHLNRNSINHEQFLQQGLHHPDHRSWGKQQQQHLHHYQPITISEGSSDKEFSKSRTDWHALDADGFVSDTIQQEE
jgi:hypothetical protein